MELWDKLQIAFKDITTTTTLGTAVLNPSQYERYIRELQHKATILKDARLVEMPTITYDVDRIGFAGRVLQAPPAEGTSFNLADASNPVATRVRLTASDIIGVVSITDQSLLAAVERGNLKDTVMELFTERAGLDIEELGVQGDTSSSDAFLALQDGWLVRAGRICVNSSNASVTVSFSTGAGQTTASVDAGTSGVPITPTTIEIATGGSTVATDDGNGNIVPEVGETVTGTVDYASGHFTLSGLTASTNYAITYTAVSFNPAGTTYPEDMFEAMLQAYPTQYLRDEIRQEMRYYVPWAIENAYRNRLRSRGTQLGDEIQTSASRVAYKGIPVVFCPTMPASRAMLVHPDNLIYGVLKEVSVEQQRDILRRVTNFVLNTHVAFQVQDAEALVVAEIA